MQHGSLFIKSWQEIKDLGQGVHETNAAGGKPRSGLMAARVEHTIRANGCGYIRVMLGIPHKQGRSLRMCLPPGLCQADLTVRMNVIKPAHFHKCVKQAQPRQLLSQHTLIRG